ncbi:trace amine-associated receptor 4-like [Tubulanus polymorphus]|uniref:trace amine-associated receptor 4-like n=1 Tax=Tubulanus polymorphus TaxID=672921 RepID=UPI003DA30020
MYDDVPLEGSGFNGGGGSGDGGVLQTQLQIMLNYSRNNSRWGQVGSKTTESAILIVVASVGMVGNLAIVITILVLHDLRKTSSAFLFHHCILDFIKSTYCLPFAFSIITEQEPMFCNVLGGSFIIFVTTTAFNLLAMVMNEAYQFADMNLGIKDSANFCCVVFGISTIWFTSLILNLGVAFIPGSPSFVKGVGHCVFVYGDTRNYVLHILWIILVSFAVALTVMYLRKLHREIKMNSYYRLSTLIRATVSIDPRGSPAQTPDDHAEKILIKKIESYSLRRVYVIMTMTLLFVLFWYPLFMLTVVDPNFTTSPHGYRILTMFACSNAALSPFLFICLVKKNCCCRPDFPDMNDLETTEIPREHSSQLSIESIGHAPNRRLMMNEQNSGIYNEFFARSVDSHHSRDYLYERPQAHSSSTEVGYTSPQPGPPRHTNDNNYSPQNRRTTNVPNSLWLSSTTL